MLSDNPKEKIDASQVYSMLAYQNKIKMIVNDKK